MDILDKLLRNFGIYSRDEAYYNEIISTCSGDLKKIKEKVLSDIKEAWTNYNNDWFVDFANKSEISSIISKIKRLRLELNPIIVQDLVNKIPALKEYLEKELSKKDKWKDEDFENDFDDSTILELAYNYAIIENRIDLGLDDFDVKEINYDALIGNSTKLYINEIKSLKDFEKNYERIIKYNEYRKLVSVTKDPELKAKYEKEVLKYRNLIVESNLCLALPIANRYKNSDLDYLELVQEGSIGIITALEKFDPDRSYAFSTYATWWIRQAITRYLMTNSRTIRVPVHLYEEYNKVLKARNDLKNEIFRDPTNEEIAARLGWPLNKVIWIFKSFEVQISLDAPVNDAEMDDSDNFYTFIPDEHDYEEDLFIAEFTENVLKGLKPKEEFVMRMRFGLPDGKDPRYERPHTLEEVGQILNLTRERVRQIEMKVINRVRNRENIEVLHYTNKKRCGFWEYFIGYSEEKVLEKVKYLSEKDLTILKSKYGENLDEFHSLPSNFNGKASAVINKLKRMLKDSFYKPQYHNEFSGKIEAIHVFEKVGKSLYEITNKTSEEVLDFLSSSSKSIDMLKRVFGEDLSQPADDSNLAQGEILLLNTIIYNIRNNIVIKYNNCKLRDILECTDEELEIIVNQLRKNARFYKFTVDHFGEDLNQIVDFYIMSQNEFYSWTELYASLRHKLTKIRDMKDYNSTKTLEYILGKSEEEVKNIVNRMNKTSKIHIILNKFINKQPLTYSEKARFDHWCNEVKKRKPKDRQSLNFLLTTINKTEEEFMELYNNMDVNCNIYQVLTKMINGDSLDEEDNNLLKLWFSLKVNSDKENRINIDSLPDTLHKKVLLTDLHLTEEELIMCLCNMKPNTKKYIGIMKYINNEKMDTSEKRMMYSWKFTLKRIYGKSVEILTGTKHEGIKAPEDVELLRDVVLKMPYELRRIMELRIGLYDGTLYTVQEIAEIYSMDIEAINELINEGLETIRSQSEEKGTGRKLVK